MNTVGDNPATDTNVVSSGQRSSGSRMSRFMGKKLLLVAGIIIVLIILGLGAMWYFNSDSSKGAAYDSSSPAYARLIAAKALTMPDDNEGKGLYYNRLAMAYEDLSDYQKALDNALLADKAFTAAGSKGMSLNLNIAGYYQKLGNTGQARVYYGREIDRLESGEYKNDNAALINKLKQEKSQL